MHGTDRQPAVRLDALRQSDQPGTWLVDRSIQVAFSIFIALETWLTPIHGWIVDSLGGRRGAKLVVAVGGVLVLSVG